MPLGPVSHWETRRLREHRQCETTLRMQACHCLLISFKFGDTLDVKERENILKQWEAIQLFNFPVRDRPPYNIISLRVLSFISPAQPRRCSFSESLFSFLSCLLPSGRIECTIAPFLFRSIFATKIFYGSAVSLLIEIAAATMLKCACHEGQYQGCSGG